jgi:hypothetical protein
MMMSETTGVYQVFTTRQAEIIRLLGFHVGRERAMTKFRLLDELARAGFYMTEREFRSEIAALRKQGIMIGSSAGSNPGYYLIANMGEFDEFIATELLARIKDLQETYRAMSGSAQTQFCTALAECTGGRSSCTT